MEDRVGLEIPLWPPDEDATPPKAPEVSASSGVIIIHSDGTEEHL